MANAGHNILTDKQAELLAFLRKAEVENRLVTMAEILAASGYKKSAFSTDLSKGRYSRFLRQSDKKNCYHVQNTIGVSEEGFARALSQKVDHEDVAFRLKSPLGKALLRRSRDNMILALELFNRPSVENRLDAFAMIFITAWDQLLKSRLVEDQGEASIFKPTARPGKARETHPFQTLLDHFYSDSTGPIRRNLQRIQSLRDEAAHLMMPELQSSLARIFQSGVIRYTEEFLDFASTPFLPRTAIGLLTLVGDQDEPTVVHLQTRYGKSTGKEIFDLLENLRKEISTVNDPAFAIPLNYRLQFSSNSDVAAVVLTKGKDIGERALVVEKPVDIEKSHPYLSGDVVNEVNASVTSRMNESDLRSRFSTTKDNRTRFSSYDFQAVLLKEGWRKSNNTYHHHITRPTTHRYSAEAVHSIVDQLCRNPDYLFRARESLANKQRRERSRNKAGQKDGAAIQPTLKGVNLT